MHEYNREIHVVRYEGNRYPILAPSYELATHTADCYFGGDWTPDKPGATYAPLRASLVWHPQHTEAHNREYLERRRAQ